MQGLYIHYPFPRQQEAAENDKPHTDRSRKLSLLDCLHQELSLRAKSLDSLHLDSIYIGGGTPSLLTSSEFFTLFQTLEKHFRWTDESEVTLEMNPVDVSTPFVKELRQQTPVNRMSLDIRSFSQQDLDLFNCPHTVEDNHQALQLLGKSSINNISIDLVHGLPGQTLEDWESTLQTAFEHDFQHLMRDRFSLADHPSLKQKIAEQKRPLPPEETVRSQFTQLRQRCQKKGWEQYELNNFCQPGCYSRQNLIYWFEHPYLGVGPGAHSYFPGQNPPLRQWNSSSIQQYIKSIRTGELPVEEEHLTSADLYNEFVMHRLSTQWGLSLSGLRERFDSEYVRSLHQTLESYREDGLLRFEEGSWTFTPEGQFEADQILATLFIDH